MTGKFFDTHPPPYIHILIHIFNPQRLYSNSKIKRKAAKAICQDIFIRRILGKHFGQLVSDLHLLAF